jgi:hypothetical protein
MPNPFAQAPEPLWRRLTRRSASSVPKRYMVPAGAIGPLIALGVSPHGMDLAAKLAVGSVLFLGPPTLVELWWRQRCRREGERLLIRPSDRHETTRT